MAQKMNINPLPSETSSSSNSSNSITEPTGEQEIIIFASNNSNEEDSDEKVEDWSNIANSSSPSSSLPSGGSGDMEIPASAPSIKPEACAANSNEKAAFEVMGDDFPIAMDVEFSFFVCFFYGTRPEGPSSLSPVAHVVFTSFCVFVLFANRD